MSDAAFCGAEFEELELDGIVILSEEGMGDHFFSCKWQERQEFENSKPEFTIGAKCSNPHKTWDEKYVVTTLGSGWLVFSPLEIAGPGYMFFDCDEFVD